MLAAGCLLLGGCAGGQARDEATSKARTLAGLDRLAVVDLLEAQPELAGEERLSAVRELTSHDNNPYVGEMEPPVERDGDLHFFLFYSAVGMEGGGILSTYATAVLCLEMTVPARGSGDIVRRDSDCRGRADDAEWPDTAFEIDL